MSKPDFGWWRSIRFRLTLWYVMLLSITILLFSFFVYTQVDHTLLVQQNAALQTASSQLLIDVTSVNNQPAFLKTTSYQRLVARLLQQGYFGRLLNSEGAVVDRLDTTNDKIPSRLPLTPGYMTFSDSEGVTWNMYSHPIETRDNRVIGWLQIASPLTWRSGLQELLHSLLPLEIPLILLAAGAGGLFLADRALRPINHITQTAQLISTQNFSGRIAYRGKANEVGELAITFDGMLDRLEGAFEQERRFTADASHELRTPLTAIKGRIDVVLSRQRTSEEYIQALRSINHDVERLIRLSTSLLFLARMDQNLPSSRAEVVNLSDLIESLVESMQPLAQAQNIRLVNKLPQGLSIRGDFDHLIRLFFNLLDNAVKHTPAEGQVTIRGDCTKTEVCIFVDDTGHGIAPEHLPHLFKRFYRVESDRASITGSTGLGLAIAYEIARKHGGDLEVQSKLRKGTTFTVRLPLTPRHELKQ